MIADIRKRLVEVPFKPFLIRTTDGREYPVPHTDHCWIMPKGTRVAVADDHDLHSTITPLHIAAIVDLPKPRPRRSKSAR